jgi:hypothetical protein
MSANKGLDGLIEYKIALDNMENKNSFVHFRHQQICIAISKICKEMGDEAKSEQYLAEADRIKQFIV